MRCITPFLFLILLNSGNSFAQTVSTFKLSDTAFTVGSVYRSNRIDLETDNRDFTQQSKPELDSIAQFMIDHPEIVFQVSSFTDQRGSDSNNLFLSQNRANFMKQYLVKLGVREDCIAAVGYGEQYPMVPQKTIDAQKEMNAKEELYQRNRRWEFGILYIYPGTFTMKDSVFDVGDVMRIRAWFELGKTGLRPETKLLLDTVAAFLIQHPALIVEISCHTDSRGSDKYSMKLSDARAHVVFDYLVSKGVPAMNMKYAGYSDKKPLVPDAKINAVKSKQGREELYQLNRRTEITILKCR